MDFKELSDDEWPLLASMLCIQLCASVVRCGRPRIRPRVLANAILWVLTVGRSWSKLPTRYPSPTTCRHRFEEWRLDGKLDELVSVLSAVGRNFSYVNDAPHPRKNTAFKADVPSKDERSLPRVHWRSQSSWQASNGPATVRKSSESFNVNGQTQAAMETVSQLESALAQATSGDFAHQYRDGSPLAAFWKGLASKGTTATDARDTSSTSLSNVRVD